MARIPKTLLIDSGFFFALLNSRDQHHSEAIEKQDWLDMLHIALPWPILYETVNTRFVRRSSVTARFEALVKSDGTSLIDDQPYRASAFEDVISRAKTQRNPLSLVDRIIQAVLDDPIIKIDALLTFNYSDFFHICVKRGIEIL